MTTVSERAKNQARQIGYTEEEIAEAEVAAVESVGWHAEPGYIPPWQREKLRRLAQQNQPVKE